MTMYPGDLKLLIYYPDGQPPDSFHYTAASFSEKWLGVCQAMMAGGPIYTQNMGGNLAHFDVEMAGPIGRLSVHKNACYELWISKGKDDEQDRATVTHLQKFLARAGEVIKQPVSNAVADSLTPVATQPTAMLFDYCSANMTGEDKIAIVQLGLHLASAFVRAD